jgi:hypothetical protein
MSASEAIVEQWFARTVESYASPTARFLSSDQDPFRNPVGHTLRQSLTILLEELLGDMGSERIAPALDAIIRLRAVQDFPPSQAVGFLFLLKPLLRASPLEHDWAVLDARIDQLALLAFDNHMRCREQLAEIRFNASQRTIWNRVSRFAG